MEISVAKTKVMVVSRSLARLPSLEAAVFTCNGLLVEQVDTFKYLGLHFHSSGGISHLITPLKAKAAGSWAVVQQRHSQLQCGNTVNLKLFLLQGIHPLCIMVVSCGACIHPVAKHRKHGPLYSPSMTDTLNTFVGSSMLRLVLCCLRSWGWHRCSFLVATNT